MTFVGYIFVCIFVLLCGTAAISALWTVVFSILMVLNFSKSESAFSTRTLWNPMNVIFSPELLSDKGRQFRKLTLRGLVFFVASMLMGGAMGVVIVIFKG